MPTIKPLAAATVATLALALALPDANAQRRRAARAPAKPAAPAITPECADFYSAQHKAWLEAVPAPAGTHATTLLGQLVERAERQQRDLLDAAMQAPQNEAQKRLGDFWASGLDEAAVEADGANPIAPLLERINAIRRSRDIPAAIAALHQVGIPVAFNFSADIDLNDLERHIGYFSQGGMALPDPAFYTRQDAETVALMGRYRSYVEKILTLTGTPANRLAADTAAVFTVETRLAEVSASPGQPGDARRHYAPVPVAELKKLYRHLQLAEFLAAQGVSDDTVSIANPALFAQLDGLTQSVRPEQWKAYLRFQVGNAMAPYLAKAFRDASFEFHGQVLHGLSAPAPRWKQTLDAITLAAGPMLGHEYAARYLPAAGKQRAEAIAADIRASLVEAVRQSTWMSQQAKAEALAKLEKTRIEVGTPAHDLDYSIQPMGRGSFGGNMLIAATWRHREEMRRIGRHNASRRWDVLPQQPALTYDAAHNRLIITAAMLQAPVLDMAQPAATHYGSLGALAGHELSHAVTARGRHVDAQGNVRDWWTPAETAHWEGLLGRTANQYAAQDYPQLPGVKVNGHLVRDLALLDLSGLELAASALRRTQPEAGKEDWQAFHRAWAGLWAQQLGTPAATLLASSSVQPPGQWRANLGLANQKEFADAWSCTQPSVMRLAEDARIRVW